MNHPGPDQSKVAYQLPQPAGMVRDVVHPGVFSDWLADDSNWVPQAEYVWFKPLILLLREPAASA